MIFRKQMLCCRYRRRRRLHNRLIRYPILDVYGNYASRGIFPKSFSRTATEAPHTGPLCTTRAAWPRRHRNVECCGYSQHTHSISSRSLLIDFTQIEAEFHYAGTRSQDYQRCTAAGVTHLNVAEGRRAGYLTTEFHARDARFVSSRSLASFHE
jgi:hypothetical protein